MYMCTYIYIYTISPLDSNGNNIHTNGNRIHNTTTNNIDHNEPINKLPIIMSLLILPTNDYLLDNKHLIISPLIHYYHHYHYHYYYH